MKPTPTVAILNRSTVAKDADVAAMLPAWQIQVSRDFAPLWGVDAHLVFCGLQTKAPAGSWQVGLFDNSDSPGALGYHDLTVDGLPFSKVFWGTDLQYGANPSITVTHEIPEMLGDPYIASTVFTEDAAGNVTLYAYEACDAVEADVLGYPIHASVLHPPVMVSDFVTPRWFDPMAKAAEATSFKGHVHGPFSLAPGGYIGIWTPSVGWSQKEARLSLATTLTEEEQKAQHVTSFRNRAARGSRRERRRTPRHLWVPSHAD